MFNRSTLTRLAALAVIVATFAAALGAQGVRLAYHAPAFGDRTMLRYDNGCSSAITIPQRTSATGRCSDSGTRATSGAERASL